VDQLVLSAAGEPEVDPLAGGVEVAGQGAEVEPSKYSFFTSASLPARGAAPSSWRQRRSMSTSMCRRSMRSRIGRSRRGWRRNRTSHHPVVLH
jgi:hypothetical protein